MTNDTSVKAGSGSQFVFYQEMDEPNQKVMDIWATKGHDAVFSAILNVMKEQKMSYAEMRNRFG